MSSKTSSTRLLMSIAAVVCAAAIAIAGVLIWSAHAVDTSALKREREIVALVLQQSTDRVAHDQEASTAWDDAVLQLRRPELDLDWLDANLGVWFHSYYGHDETYIVDPQDRPVYAMREGKRLNPDVFAPIAAQLKPMIATLRTLREPQRVDPMAPALLSPGVSDLATFRGRPAIISVKPIVSETGNIKQEPGTEAVHISVVYLDRNFVHQLNSRYALESGRYSRTNILAPDETSLPLLRQNGKPIGYFVWKPFAPGEKVSDRLGPALALGLLLVTTVVLLLARRLRRSTMELEASEAQAQHLAFHDVLTGLPNRALFDDRLDHALAHCRRSAGKLALLYVDLDRFKQINDSLGHPAGDAVIREVAQRLSKVVRETDTVARLGGDEFAILQTGISQPAEVEIVCMRIVEELGRPFDLMGGQSFIGASIGVAIAPTDGLDRTELTRRADIALYRSKLEGRGRYTFFSSSMDETVRAREEVERDLRRALIKPGQLQVHYQPVFNAHNRALVGMEALVRWQHPDKGMITPAAFVPVAEETGLIEPLGEWVLRTACSDAAGWPMTKLSVNVSPVQLRNRAFADQVIDILRETGFKAELLELEITETALVESTEETARNLSTLRAHGVRIALDDFGTGYSSLAHLREFEVDRVKIDRSFVNAIDPVHGGSAIIEAIVNLAQAIGLQVTAEGVETVEQGRFLTDIGCEQLQGYLLSRPLTPQQIEKMLEKNNAA